MAESVSGFFDERQRLVWDNLGHFSSFRRVQDTPACNGFSVRCYATNEFIDVKCYNLNLVSRHPERKRLHKKLTNEVNLIMATVEGMAFGGIDAGGTTFKCAMSDSNGELLTTERVPTSNPDKTIKRCVEFFRNAEKGLGRRLVGLGIGSFGPLDVDPRSDRYGTILNTPKVGWSMTPLKSMFERELGVPVAINTDVNVALHAELRSGASLGCTKAAYITVGTGIGAGIKINEDYLGFPSHPEFGHISVKRHKRDENFSAVCPFHGDCLEGLASAPAFEKRFGNPRDLPVDHIGWDIEAFYLAQACMSLTLTARLDRIVIGGGLLQASQLISLIREQFLAINNNYLPFTEREVAEMIVYPKHGDNAGLMGALMLANDLMAGSKQH